VICFSARVVSGFHRDIDEIYPPLGYYAALSGNSVPTLRYNLSVPYSWVRPLKMGPIGCPETSVRTNTLR
jgi:hypothetical protein